MTATLTTWLLAIAPIALIMLLMTVFKKSVVSSALAGLVLVVISGIAVFKGSPILITLEAAKGLWSAFLIIYIIWAAILLYQVGEKAGAFTVIRRRMRRLFPNELLLLLAMGWIFESFLQGITGFGVPVAVGAPLLIAIGVDPVYAVVIPLLGQAWGNTYGTLAAAWDSLVMATGLSAGSSEYISTAVWTAVFLLIWNMIAGFIITAIYGRWEGIKKGFPAVLVIGLVQGGGELLLSMVNTTIACFIPAALSLIAIFLLGRTSIYSKEWMLKDSPVMRRDQLDASVSSADCIEAENKYGMNLLDAFIPYIVLSVVTLVILLVPSVNAALGKLSISFSFPETVTGLGHVNAAIHSFSPWAPLTHAGTFLLISALFGLMYYNRKGWMDRDACKRAFKDSFRMISNAAIATAAMVVMAKIMSGTGQIIILAQGIASVMGGSCLLFTPIIGYLGTFVTGSNVNSNVLFGEFQYMTAGMLGADPSVVLASQTSGAAVGSAISPGKIILGTSTTGSEGSESQILKLMLKYTLPFVVLLGAATMAITL